MSALSHRERFMLALNHQETDRVAMDFGSTACSSIVSEAYDILKKHLGMTHETKRYTLQGQVALPDESILELFDVDARPLIIGPFSDVRILNSDSYIDAWGTRWEKKGGHYLNMQGVFEGIEPSIESLEKHAWPDPDDPKLYAGLRERAEHLRKTTDYALVLGLPLGIVHMCQFMRGYGEFLMDLYSEPEYITRMMDIATNVWIRIAKNALDAVGTNVDVVAWGDDLGLQHSMLMSPDLYRSMVKPFHKKMMDTIKEKTEAKIHYHTCGSVYPLLDDLIEIGMDALNPVQVSAKDMDPAALKKDFGSRITFWGGIDTHRILPFGTPEEVREEVRRMVSIMGPNGGFILGSVHDIQADVPPENLIAMFEEAKIAKW